MRKYNVDPSDVLPIGISIVLATVMICILLAAIASLAQSHRLRQRQAIAHTLTVFNDGMNASSNSVPIMGNPYELGTDDRNTWMKGWGNYRGQK